MKLRTKFYFILFIIFSGCSLEKMIQRKGSDAAIKIIDKDRGKNWPPIIDSINSSYLKGTVGGIIQNGFRDHNNTCDLSLSKNNRDYIPKNVKSKIKDFEKDSVETALISIENILFYKFHKIEIVNPINKNHLSLVNKRLPKLSFQTKFGYDVADGFPTFIYIGNCTSQISGDLEAEFKPPIGSVSNAVKMDKKKSSKLIIYSGRFVSPLSKIFDSPSNDQTLVLFDLWDFYKTSENFNDSIYYLREFKGIAIKHFSSSSEISKLDISASANIGMIPMASIIGNSSLNTSVKNLFNSKDWKTLIFPDYDNVMNTRKSFFEPFKNIEYIKNYFLQNVTILEERAPIMKQATIYKHELFIEGFPEEKSKNNYWELDSISNNIFQEGTIQVNTDYIKNKREKKGCKITISGMPKSNNFTTNTNNDVSVYYRFKNKNAFAIDNQTLKIEFKNGIIQTNKAPRLNYETFVEAEKVSIQGDTIVKFKWKLNPIILDKGNEINRDILPTIDTIFVQGGDNLDISTIGNGIVQKNRQTNEYQISLLSDNKYLMNLNNGYTDTKKYNLNIVLWITLENNRRVKKTISTILSMPVVTKTSRIVNTE